MSAARLHKRAAKKAVAKKTAAKKKAARAKKAAKTPAKTKKTAPRANNAEKPRAKVRAYRNKRQTRINIPDAGNAHEGKLRAPKSPKTQYEFDPHDRPQLQWAGRAERPQLNIQNLPLHVHERVDPVEIVRHTLRKNGEEQPALFETPGENLPAERAVEFYRHRKNWTNRFIAGDSLLVMNSLIEKEHLAGQVQCVYMDPPYGIKYGSNFQPFVDKRDVRDRNRRDLTSEPEMIRAFRDTWELGVHSYLSYLRDRLLLCRKLLAKTGSCFVQISDENVHLVRCLMDEIFGAENFISEIVFRKTSNLTAEFLPTSSDFILWFAKNKAHAKFNRLFVPKTFRNVSSDSFGCVELPDGSWRRLTSAEKQYPESLPKEWRLFALGDLTSSHYYESPPFEFEGATYTPKGRYWSTSIEGLKRLAKAKRLAAVGDTLRYKRFFDDFPVTFPSNVWTDTGTGTQTDARIYVVQTSNKVVQRCILMATDPGDLVFDPTCGSGTAAYVAEQWGRRWITCDTSRVALALARQRLMTATFPYYKLWDGDVDVDAGFALESCKRVTLKSVANGLPPETVELHDRPKVDADKIRVTGPFTMEAAPSPVTRLVKRPEEFADMAKDPESKEGMIGDEESRMGDSHRHRVWQVVFESAGIRMKGGRKLEVDRVRPYKADALNLHSTFQTREENPKSGFVSFGPEFASMSRRQVDLALEEAAAQKPLHPLLVFAAFEFDPEAARRLDEAKLKGVTILKVKISMDLQTEDLKHSELGSDLFWLMGCPDAELRQLESGDDAGKWVVRVRGFDYYDPVSGKLTEGISDDIAMWMLDTDYDGRSVYPRQVFFPLSDGRRMWKELARSLRVEVDAELMERFAGKESLPFELKGKRVAVRIIDKRGIESLSVLEAKS